jgi:hypothetical protein
MAQNTAATREDEADLTSEPSSHPEFKHFLDLPAEIRIMIYGLVLCYDEAIEPNMVLVLPGFLLVNHSLSRTTC